MSFSTISLVPEQPAHAAAIHTIHDTVFGPGRFARTAYRVREGIGHHADLSLVALHDDEVVGGNWQTRIDVGGVKGVLLGPLAVATGYEGKGIGKALLEASLKLAREAGAQFVLLVGDAPYYARAGFVRVLHSAMVWPGPVDPMRVLAVEFDTGAVEAARGQIRAVHAW